ncbi:MAG: hypothetical protein H6833_12315 [Planctomycetes bacterium]|nr:hypothetical protein [Planctomycetota bacterium]
MMRLTLVLLTLASQAAAQSVYDFENLSGSDPRPFTLLHGQDNWNEQTFNATNRAGVTATLSHDGSQCVRFEEAGASVATHASRINDANWSIPQSLGTEAAYTFQADMQVGYWGGGRRDGTSCPGQFVPLYLHLLPRRHHVRRVVCAARRDGVDHPAGARRLEALHDERLSTRGTRDVERNGQRRVAVAHHPNLGEHLLTALETTVASFVHGIMLLGFLCG